jgi:hypothetical protein
VAPSQVDAPPYSIANNNVRLPLSFRTMPVTARHYDGSLQYNTHNLYGLSQAAATSRALHTLHDGAKRPFVLTRYVLCPEVLLTVGLLSKQFLWVLLPLFGGHLKPSLISLRSEFGKKQLRHSELFSAIYFPHQKHYCYDCAHLGNWRSPISKACVMFASTESRRLFSQGPTLIFKIRVFSSLSAITYSEAL